MFKVLTREELLFTRRASPSVTIFSAALRWHRAEQSQSINCHEVIKGAKSFAFFSSTRAWVRVTRAFRLTQIAMMIWNSAPSLSLLLLPLAPKFMPSLWKWAPTTCRVCVLRNCLKFGSSKAEIFPFGFTSRQHRKKKQGGSHGKWHIS